MICECKRDVNLCKQFYKVGHAATSNIKDFVDVTI